MFQENVLFSTLGSYKIGGPVKYFSVPKTVPELIEALREAKVKNLKILILGGGTNLLPSDSGFDGLVLKPNIIDIEVSGEEISAGAGFLISELLNSTISNSLSGLEWAGGLPGTLGGAIRGNAGAFGGEMKDIVKRVRSLDAETFEEKDRSASECEFGYRTSIFKKTNGREIITSALLQLKKGDHATIKQVIEEKILYRKTRHPMEYPNIGSIFKNVDASSMPREHAPEVAHVIKNDPFPVVPTAYLISETGLKGVTSGGAMISPKHPNFIVNVGNARALDVETLIALVKGEVKKKFGVVLEEEITRV